MDIAAIALYMQSLPPVPTAIWLIDRPDAYWRLKALVAQVQTVQPLANGYHHIEGLPVLEYKLTDLLTRVEDLRQKGLNERNLENLYPFRAPGIYVQMSKGQHLVLEGL